AGILVARFAGANPAPFLAIQALVLSLGAAVSLGLQDVKAPTGAAHTIRSALQDVREGLVYSFKNSIMSPMLISATYVGVFVVGSFQVLFPLIVRDHYGGTAQAQAGQLGTLFACFWFASFVSAVILSRMKPLRHPGRALVVSHLISAAMLGTFAFDKSFGLFIAIV